MGEEIAIGIASQLCEGILRYVDHSEIVLGVVQWLETKISWNEFKKHLKFHFPLWVEIDDITSTVFTGHIA